MAYRRRARRTPAVRIIPAGTVTPSNVFGNSDVVTKHNVRIYESVQEFLDDAERVPESKRGDFASPSWNDNETYSNSLNMTRTGNDSLVSEAETMLEQIDAVTEGAPVRQWQPSPMGAYPVVPEYLAGMPFCMRQLSETPEQSPLNVYVSTTSSGGIRPEQLKQRGIAILALILKVQQVRPISLYLTAELGNRAEGIAATMCIKMQSNPISLAHVCYCLTSAGFARNLTYRVGDTLGSAGNFNPMFDNWKHTKKYADWLLGAVNGSENDLYVGSPFLNDPLLTNPIGWLNEQVARFNGGDAQ